MKNFTLNKKYKYHDGAVLEMGRELNRDIIEDLKEAKEYMSEASYKEHRKEQNRVRIAALGLKLIQGGKE